MNTLPAAGKWSIMAGSNGPWLGSIWGMGWVTGMPNSIGGYIAAGGNRHKVQWGVKMAKGIGKYIWWPCILVKRKKNWERTWGVVGAKSLQDEKEH